MQLFHPTATRAGKASSFLAAFVVLSSCTVVVAEFGDTADPTFNCPALTTCAQVCVANVTDCPAEMACPAANETLCADGSCAVFCGEELETPCVFLCAPVACNRIDDTFDQCQEKYGPLYDAETVCGEEESAYELTLLQFNEPAFVVGYCWVSILSFLIVAWCAFK